MLKQRTTQTQVRIICQRQRSKFQIPTYRTVNLLNIRNKNQAKNMKSLNKGKYNSGLSQIPQKQHSLLENGSNNKIKMGVPFT